MKYLKFSPTDLLILFIVLISAHSYFVLREHLVAQLLCFSGAVAFHFFKQKNVRKFLSLMGLFFCSFWLLEISYPVIGSVFWPIDLFIGALILFVIAKYFFKTNSQISWSWRFDKKMLLSVVAIVIPSLVCLVIYFINNKAVADKWPLPQLPLWAIPLAVIFIALINGLREEIYFRFTLQSYLMETLSPQLAILCVSIVFGYMHFQGGFPEGGIGVCLTTLYGAIIGIQFYYFKSATLSWITHSITDAVMFAIILWSKS